MHDDVRAPFGRAVEIMRVLSPEARDPIVTRRAKSDPGPFDLIGIHVHPPAAIPQWRCHVCCSLSAGASAPRWIFEAEDVITRR